MAQGNARTGALTQNYNALRPRNMPLFMGSFNYLLVPRERGRGAVTSYDAPREALLECQRFSARRDRSTKQPPELLTPSRRAWPCSEGTRSRCSFLGRRSRCS